MEKQAEKSSERQKQQVLFQINKNLTVNVQWLSSTTLRQ